MVVRPAALDQLAKIAFSFPSLSCLAANPYDRMTWPSQENVRPNSLSSEFPVSDNGNGATRLPHREDVWDLHSGQSVGLGQSIYFRVARNIAYNITGGENANRNSFRRTRRLDRTQGAGRGKIPVRSLFASVSNRPLSCEVGLRQ